MSGNWTTFYGTAAGAAAALTGLLFIAVSLRPREIRESRLMVGRARSAFYSFATITVVSLLALVATRPRLVGVAQLLAALVALAVSSRFTIAAVRAKILNDPRAAVYHAGLIVVGAGGAARALNAHAKDSSAVLAVGVLLLLVIAMSNSWQLVISHESANTEPNGNGLT